MFWRCRGERASERPANHRPGREPVYCLNRQMLMLMTLYRSRGVRLFLSPPIYICVHVYIKQPTLRLELSLTA